MQISTEYWSVTARVAEWQEIRSAPFDRDLELAVIDKEGTHALVFPCRRVLGGWVNTETQAKLMHLEPSHWREWQAR